MHEILFLSIPFYVNIKTSYSDDTWHAQTRKEVQLMAISHVQFKSFTEDDYYRLGEDTRAELIDGKFYYMAAPSRLHQEILSELHVTIHNYIHSKEGSCKVYPAPFAVKLFDDSKTIVEPDISVICNPEKLTDKGCAGAPDWIIEIVSPSDPQRDYDIKLFKYRTASVREYWIVNPMTRTVTVYDFENGSGTNQYVFENTIPVCIYEDLTINIAKLL